MARHPERIPQTREESKDPGALAHSTATGSDWLTYSTAAKTAAACRLGAHFRFAGRKYFHRTAFESPVIREQQ